MRRIEKGRNFEEWLVALAVVLITLLVLSATPASANDTAGEVEAVEAAILHVLERGIPKHQILPWPKHPLTRSPSDLRELAEAIVDGGRARNVDRFLLVAIAFRENSFGFGGIGKLGEVSTFQMTPRTAEYARHHLDAACDASTVRGAARCAAALLDHWRDRCMGLHGSLVFYATGRTCVADTEHLRWLERDRFGIADYLRARFGSRPPP